MDTCSDPPAPLSHRDPKSHCSILCHHASLPPQHLTNARCYPRVLSACGSEISAVAPALHTGCSCCDRHTQDSGCLFASWGCDQHAHLCGYGMAACLQKPCGGAEQVDLISRILCHVLSPAQPHLTAVLQLFLCLVPPSALEAGTGTSCHPSPTTAVPDSMSSRQLFLFSPSSHSQRSTHGAGRGGAKHQCVTATKQCSSWQVPRLGVQ